MTKHFLGIFLEESIIFIVQKFIKKQKKNTRILVKPSDENFEK